MHSPFSSVLEQGEERLSLLRGLAVTLEHAQQALITSNPGALELHTAHEEELCRALAELPRPLTVDLPADPASAQGQNYRKLLEEIAAIEARIRHLNLVQASLLRRSRRGLQLLNRLLTSAAITYAPLLNVPAGRAWGSSYGQP